MRAFFLKLISSPRQIALLIIGAAVLFLAIFFAKDIADIFRVLFGQAAEAKNVSILQSQWGDWADANGFQGTKMDEDGFLVIDFSQ